MTKVTFHFFILKKQINLRENLWSSSKFTSSEVASPVISEIDCNILMQEQERVFYLNELVIWGKGSNEYELSSNYIFQFLT